MKTVGEDINVTLKGKTDTNGKLCKRQKHMVNEQSLKCLNSLPNCSNR